MITTYYIISTLMFAYAVWIYFRVDSIRLFQRYKHVNLIRIVVKVDCLLMAFTLVWLMTTQQFNEAVTVKSISYLFLDLNILVLAYWHWFDSIKKPAKKESLNG